MKKVITIFLMVFACLSVSAQTSNINAISAKPNIIFILADDLGIGDVSAYGSDNNKTPIIDRLAALGIRFTHGYTAPLCGPSRARILTGRYAFRTGAVNQDRVGQIKPADETLTPGVLKPVGYKTAMIGKWSQFGLTPADFGFDEYLTFKGSGVYWSTEKKGAENYFVNGVTKPLPAHVYMPDLMHQQAVNFIAANKNKPFFLHYAMVHVHSNIQPTPDSKAGSDLYADNIAYMDKLVGKLINALDSLKLRENTLIVFMGDNGTASKNAERSSINGKQLSGKKGTMLECGSLVPTFAVWPGNVPAGIVSDMMVDASDFLPTFAELTGAKLPAGKIIDGKSFLPQLLGKPGTSREWIFMELGNKWYVRDVKYKLNREGELYDMSNAPFEEKLIKNYQDDKEANAAYTRLKAVMDNLNPAGGLLDDGDGSGRHASNADKRKEKKDKPEDQD